MKKIITTILTLIICVGCFAGVQTPASSVLDNKCEVVELEQSSVSSSFATAQAEDVANYFIQVNLKDTGRHVFYGLYGAGSGFLNLPIRTKWFKPTDNLINCDIELQFVFDNETDNFVLVVPSQISARTYLYNANIIEFSFISNYEFTLTERQYTLLQTKPYYQIILRDGHVHYKVQTDENSPHGELVYTYMSAGLPGSQQVKYRYTKFFEPKTYSTSIVAKTDNPTPPKGDIENPTDPGGDYDVIDPPITNDKDIMIKIVSYLREGLTSAGSKIQKTMAWIVIIVATMIILTVLAFFFKWFKFIFGK